MIVVSDIPDNEIDISAIRASGPGGQNVNKVSTAIHLRYNFEKSTIPGQLKRQLLNLSDKRISQDGLIVIKAQKFRSQEKNRADALQRLDEILRKAQFVQKVRKKTKVSRAAKERGSDSKRRHGQQKQMRKPVDRDG
jgi:ribosome-associated protein